MGIDTNGTRYFDRYVLLTQRDQTMSGALWDARDDASGEELTIEVIDPQHARRADIWARLQRDHALSLRLAHANVLAVHEPKRSENVVLLPMQFAANGDARSLTDVSYNEILPILIDVAEALRYAHSLGIAHLALSLRSIRLDAGNCALVSGFQFETGTPGEFAAAARKDLRDFAMLAAELLDGSTSAPRRAVPPRLRALFDAAYDSSFAPTPLSFAAIVEELELALHDTAPLEFSPYDFGQPVTAHRLHAARSVSGPWANSIPPLSDEGNLPAATMATEKSDVQVDWSALGLLPAPTLEPLAVPVRSDDSNNPELPANSLAETAPEKVRESVPASSDSHAIDAVDGVAVRRGRHVKREALFWRWLASSVAVALIGAAYYLGVKNEEFVAAQERAAERIAAIPLPTSAPVESAPRPPVATANVAVASIVPARAAPATPLEATPMRQQVARIGKLLADGQAALNEFDAARARHAFTTTLRIEPSHRGAQLGLQRVRVLDGVRVVVDDASRAEVAQNYTRAAQGYSHALTLDREHRVPRLGLERVMRAVRADGVLSGLVAAHVALGAGRLDAAHKSFRALAQTYGDDPRVRDGLQLADAALTARQLAPQMRQATKFERAKNWSAAMQVYVELLAAHPDYIPAQQGRRRVATLAESSATASSTSPSSPMTVN